MLHWIGRTCGVKRGTALAPKATFSRYRFSVSLALSLAITAGAHAVPQPDGAKRQANSQPASSVDAADCVPRAALNAYVNRSIARKAAVFKAFPGPKGGVVFLGSSIVEEGPWEALFPDLTVVNRGISADTTDGVLARLDDVIRMAPKAVVLYIGGNDFSRQGRSVQQATTGLDQILDRLSKALPNTDFVVMTLFPREQQHAAKIRGYNAHIKAISRDRMTVIDLFDQFALPDGSIKPELTNDRIHLMPQAYQAWGDALVPVLAGSAS